MTRWEWVDLQIDAAFYVMAFAMACSLGQAIRAPLADLLWEILR